MLNSDNQEMGEEKSQIISRPKLAVEFARNLKYIFDHDLLLRDDFYSEDNLKIIFNLSEIKINKDDKGIYILSSDFVGIFPKKEGPKSFGGSIASASFVGNKIKDSSGSIVAGLNFGMKEGGPNFEETQRIFGKKLVLVYQVPSPHGAPLSATAAHGNESWRYGHCDGVVKKMINLGFNSNGELSDVLIELKIN